jgi:hypothetical protein
MFIQPSLTQNQVDVILPVGEYISIGNTGNEATTVLLQSVATSAQPWNYSTIGTLFNTAQTFGPYTEDRTIRIDNRNATVEYSIGAQPQLRSFPALVLENKGPIGLVEAAATFITLTYNNNAGKVRLNSAGAHGLTAAVAVGENVYVTWSGGTGVTGLYPVTALDTDTTGTAVTIDLAYKSATVTITIAAPGVVTWTDHGLSVNDTIRFTTTGALPTGLAAGTTYYVKTVLSPNTFTVSASAGGAAITTSGTQSGVQTALVWYGTAVVAVANTAVTLTSVTVPGWSVGTGGEIEINALFSLTNSANAKNLNMTFGGSAIFTLASANVASVSVQKNIVNRGGSQIVSNTVAATGHGASTGAVVTLAINTNVDQTFAITAQPTTANELVQLEYYNMHILF